MKYISFRSISLFLLAVHCTVPAADQGPASRASSSSPAPAKLAAPAEAARPPAAMAAARRDSGDDGKREAEYYAVHPAAAAAAGAAFGPTRPTPEMIAAHRAAKAGQSSSAPAARAAFVPPTLKAMTDKQREVFNKRLKRAARDNNLEDAQKAIAEGADPNMLGGFFGSRILQGAARGGHLPTVQLLVAARANVDAPNNLGFTAMHDAAYANHPKVIMELAACGANVNCRTKAGATPMGRAVDEKHIDAQQTLLRLGIDHQTYMSMAAHAIKKDNLDLMQRLVDSGFDVNTQLKIAEADASMGVLLFAAMHGKPRMIDYLIACKADINAKSVIGTAGGVNPYWAALIAEKDDNAAALIRAGADKSAIPDYLAGLPLADVRAQLVGDITKNKPQLLGALVETGHLGEDDLNALEVEKTLGVEKGSVLTRAVMTRDNDTLKKKDAEGYITIPRLMKKDKTGACLWHWPFLVGNREAAQLFMAISRRPIAPAAVPRTWQEKASAGFRSMGRKIGIDDKPIVFDVFAENSGKENAFAIAQRRGHYHMINDLYDYHAPERALIVAAWRARYPAMLPPVAQIAAEYVYGGRVEIPVTPAIEAPGSPKAAGGAAAAAAAAVPTESAKVESKEGKEELVKKD